MLRPMLLVVLACAPAPEESPPSFSEASAALLREFEVGDPAPTAQVVADWLVTHVDEQEGFALDPLAEGDFVDILPHPDAAAVDSLLGIGVTHRVAGTLDQHVAVVPEADQSFADPATYDRWDRTLTEGTAQGFVGGEGLRTANQIEKGGPFGVVIPYPIEKDYRWITLTQGDTCMFRSWVTESGFSDNGKNGLVAGFTIELWVPDDAGLIWYNASWADIVTEVDGIIDPDYEVAQVIAGTVDYMEGTAAHATGQDR
jgi:hypothetical protein